MNMIFWKYLQGQFSVRENWFYLFNSGGQTIGQKITPLQYVKVHSNTNPAMFLKIFCAF
jgi:hypothetical protein